MADVHISDHILYDILARLPVESLLRFKCVSKHWNSLIKDPYLMKLRPRRRMILLSCNKSLVAIDDNVHVEGTTIVDDVTLSGATIVGTFNGIVLLLLDKDMRHQLILYNPFTRASKMLPNLSSHYWWEYTFGFGYGATMDDLKIVRLESFSYDYQIFDDCDVFSFKNRSWGKIKNNIQDIGFRYGDVGKFLNGFLYWIGYSKLYKMVIVALNVTDMVLSKINPPVQFSNENSPLGTIDGCLCMIDKSGDMGFDVWVMKEQGVESSWTKTWSFPLRIRLQGYYFSKLYRPVCILDSGRILIMDCAYQLIIYYTSNGSFKKLNLPEEIMDGIEYVESLVSPSNLCFV